MSAQASHVTAAPLTGSSCTPLLAALTASGSEAAAAWSAWRKSVDIEHLAWSDMQILPLLSGPRLEDWLGGDPAAAILKGIVRRAWSEAQVRLGTAREVVACLAQAGCDGATVTGALGAYLRGLGSAAIRPVLEIRILIARRHRARAAEALEAEGWQPRDKLPTHDWLDRMNHVLYNRNGTRLYLHWRLLNVEPNRAIACEREFLCERRIVAAIGASFRILSPGHALLEALAERAESVDALPWQADAALVLCGAESIDWKRWSVVAGRYQPQVFERLPELRAIGLNIPELSSPRVQKLGHFMETLLPAAMAWARRISAAVGKA